MERISFNRRIAAALGLLLCVSTAAHANWLSALTKAGKAAEHVHPHTLPHGNFGALGRALERVAELPKGSKPALAAHATPEGHWQFANRDGQVFTAATPEEFQRLLPTLAPEAVGRDGKISLYLSEDSVFANKDHLSKLPKDADLNLVTEKGTFPVAGAGENLHLAYKPDVLVSLADQSMLNEVLASLTRPLNKSNIRTIAIEPGADAFLSSVPKFDAASKAALADKLDPVHLVKAFGAIRGQTALMVGKIEGGKVTFITAKGETAVRDLDELMNAARANDVNLVLLHSLNPRQPGGKNWLWQTYEVGGFNDAIAKATFGDFIEALGAKRGAMRVSAVPDSYGRVRISAVTDESARPAATLSHGLFEKLTEVTGEVLTNAVEVSARDDATEKEYDARLIPGIPTYIQIPYLAGIFMGLFGFATSRSWWRKLWAPSERVAGQSWIGHWLRNLHNHLAYLLLFLPFAGTFAFMWQAALGLWDQVTAPFRWLKKLFRRRVEV